MFIGLTYDLRDDYLAMGYSEIETAEFDRRSTIDAIENALLSLGHQTERIGHIKALVKKLSEGSKWDLVFNVCEGLYGMYSRESQVPALLEAYNISYVFSDPLVTALTLKKDLTKIVVKDAGFKTPAFFTVADLDDLDRAKELTFPLFAKPVAEGTSKGITEKSKVYDIDVLKKTCKNLLFEFKQPVLVEEFCSGREFTTGITGTGSDAEYIGSLEIVLKGGAEKNAYSYINKENCEELVEYRLVTDKSLNEELKEKSLGIWKTLGCRDAGRIDFMLDKNNELNFIEANPLAGMNPEHSDLPILFDKLGLTYNNLIEKIVSSAVKRKL